MAQTNSAKNHCCKSMTQAVTFQCEQHSGAWACADALVGYLPKFNEYGLIIHDGGTSISLIQYCPWCGTKLPQSKRNEWFDTLEALGFDNPSEQEIPSKFNSNEWYES